MTKFNDLQSVKVANTYFRENTSVVNVDCNYVDFTNNDAEEAFKDCSELTTVTNLSNNLTKMKTTFRNCQKIKTPPAIPSSVTDMTFCFYDCRGMTSAPDLSNCTSLTSIERCFGYNYELLETPVVPSTVTNMKNICQGCTKITTFPNIPDGVTNLTYAFEQCQSVVDCNITIPSQITNLNHTFSRCSGLKGKIFIESENITDATGCFSDTTNVKKVYIPFKSNGVNTTTYNSFISAGYDESGTSCGVTLLDLNSYVPPVHYDFDDTDGVSQTFAWTDTLATSQEKSSSETTVSTTGVLCGGNMSVNGITIGHTSNNEKAPSDESYVSFLFNINSGMFKPQTLSFDIRKNGTNGGSVLVSVLFDNYDAETNVCTLATIARDNENPNYTHADIDLSQFNLGASKGTVLVKFYLYNQGNTKTFTLYNVNLTGLLKGSTQANSGSTGSGVVEFV